MDGLRMAVRDGRDAGWLVLLDGVVIGDCGTHGPPDADGCVEIGYGLAAPYRGRGHGSDLVRLLTRLLLERADVRRVAAKVEPANVPSRRALERSGFTVAGRDGERILYTRQE